MEPHGLAGLVFSAALCALAACMGGDDGAATMSTTPVEPVDGGTMGDAATTTDAGPTMSSPTACNGTVHTSASAGPAAPAPPSLGVAPGLRLEMIASVPQARELTALPNGDLLVGTAGKSVYVIPNADAADAAARPGAPAVFATFDDAPAQGVAFSKATCTVFVGTQHGIYSIPYADGQVEAGVAHSIAMVRTGGVVHTALDSDTHSTTSVAVASGMLYVGVGSSCNACTEVDPTRATIQVMQLDGSGMATRATRLRNPIALAENPATGSLWAGNAGQDGLPLGHPYELFDLVTAHPTPADYGWPDCEENQTPYRAGASCATTVVPLVELPAYSTIIGAAFYPVQPTGPYAFPAAYRGGALLTAHGSWHTEPDGTFYTPPRVAHVAMRGDAPNVPVNWTDPATQWNEVVGGFQLADGKTRIGRPAGIAVGPLGSVFVSDDQASLVYRLRPTARQ